MSKFFYYLWDRFADRMEELLFLGGAFIDFMDTIIDAASQFLKAVAIVTPAFLKDPVNLMNTVFLLFFLATIFL